jgi:hypothetical protein
MLAGELDYLRMAASWSCHVAQPKYSRTEMYSRDPQRGYPAGTAGGSTRRSGEGQPCLLVHWPTIIYPEYKQM